ncbi:hypothetical protein NLY43_32355 [Mesorhizobium sp. C416B]|uniref:hypothetical protein n=1 Tax=Mesorhizobium sp. C416B TaxID=2956834 RepID=UPI002574B059|nr:hypothetical protein [Mesorhizobium sp. C416B]WJI63213.1 hypothetical protein NLY43_32355 [Mesorhizobium sp. C416B]
MYRVERLVDEIDGKDRPATARLVDLAMTGEMNETGRDFTDQFLERGEIAIEAAVAVKLAQRRDLVLLKAQRALVEIGGRDGRDAGEGHAVERVVDL